MLDFKEWVTKVAGKLTYLLDPVDTPTVSWVKGANGFELHAKLDQLHVTPDVVGGAEDGANPIFTSEYDADTDEYIVSWRDFDIQFRSIGFSSTTQAYTRRGTEIKTIAAGTFKFDYSFISAYSIYDIDLILCEINDEPVIYWTNTQSAGTVADSPTNTKRMWNTAVSSGTTVLQGLTIPVAYTNKDPLEIDYENELSYFFDSRWSYNTGTDKFAFQTMYANPHLTGTDLTYLEKVRLWQVGNSFADTLILGWNSNDPGRTVNANLTDVDDYDDFRHVCTVSTDSSGNLTNVFVRALGGPLAPFGRTGVRTFDDNSGNTHTVWMTHGIIQSWTIT